MLQKPGKRGFDYLHASVSRGVATERPLLLQEASRDHLANRAARLLARRSTERPSGAREPVFNLIVLLFFDMGCEAEVCPHPAAGLRARPITSDRSTSVFPVHVRSYRP